MILSPNTTTNVDSSCYIHWRYQIWQVSPTMWRRKLKSKPQAGLRQYSETKGGSLDLMNVPTCYNLKNRKLKKTAMDSIRERLDFENTYVQEFLHVFNKGLGARIFEFYTNSVLHKKDLIYLHTRLFGLCWLRRRDCRVGTLTLKTSVFVQKRESF